MNAINDMKRIPKKFATTKLERAALRWINDRATDYETGAAGVVKDLMYGGCQSGMVGELIYYRGWVIAWIIEGFAEPKSFY